MAGCVVTLLAKLFALLAALLAAWLLGLLHYWRQLCIVGGIIALLAPLLAAFLHYCMRFLHYWLHIFGCIVTCLPAEAHLHSWHCCHMFNRAGL